MPGLDPETLEKLRRGFALRLDRMGMFFLGNDAVTHPRIVDLFRRGLDLSDDGEPIVRVGEQWAYVAVADCMLRAMRVVEDEHSRLALVLDDGRTVPLDPERLWEEPGQGLRCTAPSTATRRPLSVRFTNPAQMDLDRWLTWPAGEDTRPRLRIGPLDLEIPGTRPSADV